MKSMITNATPELIGDLKVMNPGCDISDIITSTDGFSVYVGFIKTGKDGLEYRSIPSLDNRYAINENGTKLINVSSGREIKINLDMHHSKIGYYAAFINKNGIVRRIMIHKVVAECWLGPKPPDLEIDHIDRNPHNNHYTNLRYVTHSEQMKNRILSQRIIEQAKLNCRKYINEKVIKPVKLIADTGDVFSFKSQTESALWLSNKLNIPKERIRRSILVERKPVFEGYRIFHGNDAIIQLPSDLVGSLERFNDGKRAEEHDRVKHGVTE